MMFKKGALNPKMLILLVVAIAMVGALLPNLFPPLSSGNLTAVGAPTFLVATAGLVIGAILITWFIRNIR